MTSNTLASKLAALLDAGFTYKAIAERANCDSSTIFRIRSGAVTNPSYSVGSAIDVMYASLNRKPKRTAA
ncbi:helix-turn-helix domain-containing protein [Azotobacter chroococcum]|uniref:helix-turn-helix domain-containing protein n=1 Tax=Azotobacter chroococcum TaxID=353 RepID=UPI0010AE8B8D|nr:helix-turn-helix domain-containing protein [Azotobacter chroococcum]TKD30004.1 helix-turn-helix domain-containing protein [Azotobacter chroococcum]